MADGPAHGTFCWNELMTRDTGKAAKFYAELLGWEPVDSGMPGMQYTIFKALSLVCASPCPADKIFSGAWRWAMAESLPRRNIPVQIGSSDEAGA